MVDLDVTQQASRIGEKDKRVGRCEATFHITPKIQHKVRALRKRPVVRVNRCWSCPDSTAVRALPLPSERRVVCTASTRFVPSVSRTTASLPSD